MRQHVRVYSGSETTWPLGRLATFAGPLVYIAVTLVRLVAYIPSRITPTAWDGSGYMALAARPFGDLLGQEKPFLLPLFYQLTGQDYELASNLQFLLSLVAWSVLAWQIGRMLAPSSLSICGQAIVLLLSATPIVSYWDRSIMSESLSISLLALMLACALAFASKRGVAAGVGFVLFSILWAFTRDANAYLLVVLVAILLVLAVRLRPRWVYIAAAAVLAVTVVVCLWDADRGQRWKFPLLNVISQRILTNSDATSYFVERGMPVSPKLMTLAGKYAHDDDWAYYRAPELADFRQWLDSRGKSTYVSYLLAHPVQDITAPINYFPIIFSTPDIGNYKPIGMQNPLGWGVEQVVAPVGPWLALLVLPSAFAVIALIMVQGRRRIASWNPGLVVAPMLLLMSIACAYLTWLGDDMDLERHAVQASILLRLGLWLLLLFAAMGLWKTLRSETTRSVQSPLPTIVPPPAIE